MRWEFKAFRYILINFAVSNFNDYWNLYIPRFKTIFSVQIIQLCMCVRNHKWKVGFKVSDIEYSLSTKSVISLVIIYMGLINIKFFFINPLKD